MFGLLALAPAWGSICAEEVDLPRYPAISPNGEEITFSWRGDIWRVDTEGGEARRLSTHPGVDSRSAWSSDGELIAFESDRDGYRADAGHKGALSRDELWALDDFTRK